MSNNKRCPLCAKEKPIKDFTDNKFYKEHVVCIKCCVKASKRIAKLTDFDVELCENLDLNYDLLNSYQGLLFDKQFDSQENIINELENDPLEDNVPSFPLTTITKA